MSKIKTLRRTSKNGLEHSPSFSYTCRRRNGLSHKEKVPLTLSNPKQRSSTLKKREGKLEFLKVGMLNLYIYIFNPKASLMVRMDFFVLTARV